MADGGAASQQRLGRDIYTSIQDSASGSTRWLEFHEDTAEISHVLLDINAKSDEYREQLLQWARGVDVNDYDNDGNTSEVRAQMGDPLHSSQLIFDYGDSEATSLLFVGTNHGFLHAIDTETGIEEFAYIPEALLGNLDTIFANNIVPHEAKPYGLDGELVSWHNDLNDNALVDGSDTAYLYFGMRRGGRNYYALDVTDPDSPELLWTIEGGTGDFSELGQTWSRPIKSTVNYNGSDRDVLFFAAGYDTANDAEALRTSDSVGRGLFMVDATTGQLLLKRDITDLDDMKYSIPSDLRIINPDGDAYDDVIFVGDTGGQLWRFDINNFETADANFLTGYVLASFGDTEEEENRQFFYEPDIALASDPDYGVFLNIAIGSGARPNPNSTTTQDSFYSVRDWNVYGPPLNNSGVIEYPNVIEEDDLVNVTDSLAEDVTLGSLEAGWFFRFATDGEKALSGALTLNNELYFTTYVPSTSTAAGLCGPSIGRGNIYQVGLFDGAPANGSSGNVASDSYTQLKQAGIPAGVVAVIAEASPDSVATFVGMEAVGDEADIAPFERIFWAEQ